MMLDLGTSTLYGFNQDEDQAQGLSKASDLKWGAVVG